MCWICEQILTYERFNRATILNGWHAVRLVWRTMHLHPTYYELSATLSPNIFFGSGFF